LKNWKIEKKKKKKKKKHELTESFCNGCTLRHSNEVKIHFSSSFVVILLILTQRNKKVFPFK